MCDETVKAWFENLIKNNPKEFKNKTIIEVGSKEFNGGVRPIITSCGKPLSYTGVDITNGKYVDIVVPAEKLVEKFGENSFDVVISTEMLEHVFDWTTVVDNLKRVLKPNGTIFITTRTFGFPYHAYPFDFWRYEPEDMKTIFADFHIEKLHYDAETNGVWLKARKPCNWRKRQLSYELYSIAIGKRSLLPVSITLKRKMLVLLQLLLQNTLLKASLESSIPFRSKTKLVLKKYRLVV